MCRSVLKSEFSVMSSRGPTLRSRVTKVIFTIVLGSFAFLLYFSNKYSVASYKYFDYNGGKLFNLISHKEEVDGFIKKRQVPTSSNLGSILFKFENPSKYAGKQNRTFVVLIWKYWGWLKQRHLHNYGSSREDALENCSVKNCIFSGENDLLNAADAVLIHLQKGDIPHVQYRNPRQRWVFLNDESPKNAFSLSKRVPSWTKFANIFNWSMTYKSDADVPVPYGRTIPLSKPFKPDLTSYNQLTELIPNWKIKRNDVLATVLISNCAVKRRMDFINELKEHMVVDVYGKCADTEETRNRCPGHFRSDCQPISEYLFYLVLENSMCSQYLTEKIFYHAYLKGAIPVIMGPSAEDCENLLPPNSYLYVDSNTKMEELAEHMLSISQNPTVLISFHMWRNHFKVVNEHGYFGTRSYHLCRLCEALNYNDENPRVYDKNDLKWFLDPSLTCD